MSAAPVDVSAVPVDVSAVPVDMSAVPILGGVRLQMRMRVGTDVWSAMAIASSNVRLGGAGRVFLVPAADSKRRGPI